MASLQEAIDYARANPKSDYAHWLKDRIETGKADADALKEGVDLSWAGRPSLEQMKSAAPVAEAPGASEEVPDTAEEVAPTEKPKPDISKVGKDAAQIALGVGKGALEAARFAPKILQEGGQRIIAAIDPNRDLAQVKEEMGIKSLDSSQPEGQAVEEMLEAKNPEQKAGKVLETAAEVLLPTGGAAKAIVPPALMAAKKGAKAAKEVAEPATKVAGQAVRTGWTKIKNFVNDIKETGAAREALELEKGKNAVRVLEETGSPEFVNMVDSTKSALDLKAKRKMLELAEQHPKMGGKGNVTSLPRQVVAEEYIVPRVNVLEKRLKDLGKQIGNFGGSTDSFGRSIAKKRVDTTDVFNALVKEARRFDVRVGMRDGELVFEAAPGVSGVDQARITAIRGLFDGFKPDAATFKKTGQLRTSNTYDQLAKTRKNLSALTKRTDAAKEVVGPGGAVDNARRIIAKKIGPEYFQATREFSDIARVLEQLDPDVKVRLSDDALEEITKVKMSDYARRLLSYNAAQSKAVFKSLDELYTKEAARRGLKVDKQDIADLVDFAGAIEEGFGITPRNTFFGQSKNAVESAIGNIPVTVGGVVNTVKNIATKANRNDKRAIEAMKAYLDEVIAKQK